MTFEQFLRAGLPLLGYDWERFRGRRFRRRLVAARESVHAQSWDELFGRIGEPSVRRILRRCLTRTISRFSRNEAVFRKLTQVVLPEVARQRARGEPLIVWCAGCASGQEAFSIAMLAGVGREVSAGLADVRIVGSDIDSEALRRGRRDEWTAGELRELPGEVARHALATGVRGVSLAPWVRSKVILIQASLFDGPPVSRAHVILCRNSVMTYLHGMEREAAMARIAQVLCPGGWLILGRKEHLPVRWAARWDLVPEGRQMYRKRRPEV